MSNIASVVKHRGLVIGSEATRLAFYFTTSGAGVPTLGISHGEMVSIVQATNLYTITVPIGAKMCVQLTYDNASLTHVITVDEALGTIAIQFSGSFFSKRCDVDVVYHDSETNN